MGYDVPAEWTVAGCDVIVGWERECANGPFGYCRVQTMGAVADREDADCPDSLRTVTGLDPNVGMSDLRLAAREGASRVRKIYSRGDHIPTVTLSDPMDVTVAGWRGVKIVATVADIRPADVCHGGSAVHTVLALSVPGLAGALLFVASVEQGYPDATDPAVIDQIIGTLRPT